MLDEGFSSVGPRASKKTPNHSLTQLVTFSNKSAAPSSVSAFPFPSLPLSRAMPRRIGQRTAWAGRRRTAWAGRRRTGASGSCRWPPPRLLPAGPRALVASTKRRNPRCLCLTPLSARGLFLGGGGSARQPDLEVPHPLLLLVLRLMARHPDPLSYLASFFTSVPI